MEMDIAIELHPVTRLAGQARFGTPRVPFLSTATLAVLAPVGVAVLWGTSFVASKAALTEMPPVTLACLRFVVAALVLVPLAWWSGFRPSFDRRSALLGLTGMTLYYFFLNVGLHEASAAEATLFLGEGCLFSPHCWGRSSLASDSIVGRWADCLARSWGAARSRC
jgi:hypothetical protein